MNLLLVCLLLPVALAAPKDTKRIIGGLHLENLFDLDTLKCDVQIMLDVLGSDPTEKACEDECHKLLTDGAVLDYGCPLTCHVFQNLAHYFDEVPKPGDQNMACGGLKLDATTVLPTTAGPI